MNIITAILKSTILSLVIIISLNQLAFSQETRPDYKLIIAGGGGLPDTVFTVFREMAGSEGRLVVIPTASSREPDIEKIRSLWNNRGFEQVTVLHTRSKGTAMSEGYSAPIKNATAVWFSGGSQQRIADAYLDTPIEEELYNLVRRGGVIGGSSAGAAIQSKVMIMGGDTIPKISTGFDLIHAAIVDQHFLRRNRISRLINAVKLNPELVGYGIDEKTAIVVSDGEYKVIGESYVLSVKMIDGEIMIDSFEDGEIIISSGEE